MQTYAIGVGLTIEFLASDRKRFSLDIIKFATLKIRHISLDLVHSLVLLLQDCDGLIQGFLAPAARPGVCVCMMCTGRLEAPCLLSNIISHKIGSFIQ